MFLEGQSKARFAHLMGEIDFHALASFVPAAAMDDEIGGTLGPTRKRPIKPSRAGIGAGAGQFDLIFQSFPTMSFRPS